MKDTRMRMTFEDDKEVIIDMLKVYQYKEELNSFKRALNDVKISLQSMLNDSLTQDELCRELGDFINKDFPEIISGLNLDN